MKHAGTADNFVQHLGPNQQLGMSNSQMQISQGSHALPIANGVLLNVSGGAGSSNQLDNQGKPYTQMTNSNQVSRGNNAKYQQNSQHARSKMEGLYSTGNIQALNQTY